METPRCDTVMLSRSPPFARRSVLLLLSFWAGMPLGAQAADCLPGDDDCIVFVRLADNTPANQKFLPPEAGQGVERLRFLLDNTAYPAAVGWDPADRGQPASDYPDHFLTLFGTRAKCSAVAVGGQVLLTAAHCIYGKQRYRVVIRKAQRTLSCTPHPDF